MLRRRCLFGLPSFEHGSLRMPLIRAIRRASTQPKPQPTVTSTSTTTAPNSRPLSRFLPSSPRLSLTYSFTKYFLASAILLHIFFEYFFVLELAWGISMLPTIASANDWVLISKLYRRGRNLRVGDVVSFKHPDKMGEYAVKRIVGLPGDFVVEGSPGKGGSGRMMQVPVGHCWVIGDNLTWSRDSRTFGALPLALVTGKVVRVFSFRHGWRKLNHGLQPACAENDALD
ncbi:hypothetical protein LTS09_001621 [Friedmanniomyces endolithicus]|nr:hypothetical protein LTS09_001621 [Friedmanniomyces endolithicus]